MFKKIISSILVATMMLGLGTTIFAEDKNNSYKITLQDYINNEIGDAMSNVDWAFATLQASTVNERNISTLSLAIPFVGFSTFLDLSCFGDNVDMTQIRIENSNPNVISTFSPDQLSAIGVGKTTLIYKYGDLVQVIEVMVQDQLDDMQIQFLQNQALTNVNAKAITRDSILQKNSDMLNYEWKPTKQLMKWGTSRSYFPANTYQRGLPYTQANQCDEIAFPTKMTASDFYTESSIALGGTTYYQPRYGSDCSGYVSYCWGISRINTATFYSRAQNGTYKLLSNFKQLQPGDAVVRANDHIMLIGLNYENPPSGSSFTESYVFAYEQTPPQARYQFYTYKQLQSRPYTPISYFK